MNGKIKIAEEFIPGNYYEFRIFVWRADVEDVKCRYIKLNENGEFTFFDEKNLRIVTLEKDSDISFCVDGGSNDPYTYRYKLLSNYIHYEAEQIENSSCLKIKVWNDKGKTVESTVSLQFKIDELIKIGGLK